MKKLIFSLLILVFCMLAASNVKANDPTTLEWATSGTTTYSNAPIVSCGGSQVSFRINYDYIGAGYAKCPWTLPTLFPYRYFVYIYRDGVQVASNEPYGWFADKCKLTVYAPPVAALPGVYTAKIVFEKALVPNYTWDFVDSDFSVNPITASNGEPAPDFNINGLSVDTPVTVNIKNQLILNAAATTCEGNAYNVTVEESDSVGNKTFEYEWSKWFTGAAPDGLNLQQLATTYSYVPYYSGNDFTRQGAPLIGGEIFTGVSRHYRVGVCINQSSPTCKWGHLRIEY